MRTLFFSPFIAVILLFAGCANEEDGTTDVTAQDLSVEEQYWSNMSAQCGQAYEGEITNKPEGATLFDGDELLVVHFRECDEDILKLPFHVENLDGTWNRSRTWVIYKHEDGLELRHDHRNPDGTEEENTWYGGFTQEENEAHMMEFVSDRSLESDSEVVFGWRIEIYPGERYTYGTIRDGEWQWRLNFDLSNPLNENPPAPWGHE